MKYPDSKVHGTTWGWQEPGGPYVGFMNLAIRGLLPGHDKQRWLLDETFRDQQSVAWGITSRSASIRKALQPRSWVAISTFLEDKNMLTKQDVVELSGNWVSVTSATFHPLSNLHDEFMWNNVLCHFVIASIWLVLATINKIMLCTIQYSENIIPMDRA